MNDNGFVIPNLGSNVEFDEQDRMARILESINIPGATALDPKEGEEVENDAEIESEVTVITDSIDLPESVKEDYNVDVKSLGELAEGVVSISGTKEDISKVLEACSSDDDEEADMLEDIKEAVTLVEAEANTIIAMMTEDDSICEKVYAASKKVVGGKVIRKKKVKLTAKQVAARKRTMKKNAAKMSRKSNTGAAKRKRAKSIKVARKKGLIKESFELRDDLNQLLESKGMTISRSKLSEIVRNISESVEVEDTAEVAFEKELAIALDNILTNKGIDADSIVADTSEGLVELVAMIVDEEDLEIYLDEIAEELEDVVGTEIEFVAPTEVDEFTKLVFYAKVKVAAELETPEIDTEPTVNVVESVEGIRCKVNPGFIREGQLIYDADEKVIFRARTSSEACDESFKLTIDVVDSKLNESFNDLLGVEVMVEPDGNYYLMKEESID